MGKKSKPPPAPDYTPLAEKTATSANEAATATTMQNRPNQVDIHGNTSTWTTDAEGRPVQTQTLGAAGQQQLDAGNALVSGAQGRATDALGQPLTTEGLREVGDYDTSQLQGVDAEGLRAGAGQFQMDPTGNSKEIQDATYGLLSSQRDLARNSEIQRLKSQGLTEDSPAFQRAMLRQGQADTDAQLKSLLAGTTEYGNQFQRGLAQNQSNFGQRSDAEKFAMGLRGQQFGEQGSMIKADADARAAGLNERVGLRNQSIDELTALSSVPQGNGPAFGQFAGATDQQGVDYLGAADKQYQANVGATNAKNQGKSNTMSGIASLAGTAAMVFL